MTTGKTIALTRWTFVGKVMSLLLNMLSRLVITFLPRSIATITICSDFGAQKNKVSHCCHCFPIYLSWSDGTGCRDLSFLNVEHCYLWRHKWRWIELMGLTLVKLIVQWLDSLCVFMQITVLPWKSESVSCSVVSDSLQPHELSPSGSTSLSSI